MASTKTRIGRADHGRAMSFDEFVRADFREGWLYELARGVIVVTNVPHPNHSMIVARISGLFHNYAQAHPGVIQLQAGGGECRIRLPGMACDRHPDQAVYLTSMPLGKRPWTRWCPSIVVEVVSRGSRRRDYVEKNEEYLRVGVSEYWIVDPSKGCLVVHLRAGDTWQVATFEGNSAYESYILPGLWVRMADLI